ncbi:hypothetical protein HYPDE_26333 [Hyphomicrobium denitrificans 1NES1]|uniref:Uncharacterized protein n=1 Tax=Hyphomicrobium denitrificans 1NES1 TaxID=670307 RepID=N0B0I6_9HYPH|nr:hypothetical protein HYPDE_26333 [Hyphomicrobium denitrificans 1NES1]
MAKTVSQCSKKSSGSLKRDARTGQFTLGRGAFSSISSVEGITLTQAMHKELARTEGMNPAKRRSELAQKFGKK